MREYMTANFHELVEAMRAAGHKVRTELTHQELATATDNMRADIDEEVLNSVCGSPVLERI
jgi:hypothetical protein